MRTAHAPGRPPARAGLRMLDKSFSMHYVLRPIGMYHTYKS